MSDLLPKQRPNLSLSLKYKQNVRKLRWVALHEASHAVAYYRHDIVVEKLVMVDREDGRLRGAFVEVPFDQDYRGTRGYFVSVFAGIVANALCGVGTDGLTTDDVVKNDDIQMVLLSAVHATGVPIIMDEEKCHLDPTTIDRNAVMAKMHEVWRESVLLVTDPQNFGAIHAVANEALKHSSLDAAIIRRSIETAKPFMSIALPRRRDVVLAQVPAIWEAEVERRIRSLFGELVWH